MKKRTYLDRFLDYNFPPSTPVDVTKFAWVGDYLYDINEIKKGWLEAVDGGFRLHRDFQTYHYQRYGYYRVAQIDYPALVVYRTREAAKASLLQTYKSDLKRFQGDLEAYRLGYESARQRDQDEVSNNNSPTDPKDFIQFYGYEETARPWWKFW